MNAKRILTWEGNDENDCLWAETMQGDYTVCELNGGGWDCMFRYWQLDSKIYETKQAAMDACEADYVSRCTEFLTLYNPATHVVVSRECAEAALFNIPDSAEGGVSPREHAARAELRAALEVGK